MKTRGWRRVLRRGAMGLGAVLAVGILVLVVDGHTGFGKSATGARRERMELSPQWKDGHFDNPQPLVNHFGEMMSGLLHTSPHTSPGEPLAVEHINPQRFQSLPATGLRVTWMGHSSQLVEIDGHRILTDPVWSERVSPYSWVGPKRWFAPPIALADLPPIDAVVISHDHYDHLDRPTLLALRDSAKDSKLVFIVPLGVGAHLEYWGIPAERIVELDWWERTRVGELEVVATPARHASGRFLFDKDSTLWAGYALIGSKNRAFYSGDTGLFPAMRDIGERLGPFDVTMIETGQYHRAWPDWHIGPEQAVLAHQLLRGKVMIPVHWALFGLAYHGWTEPAERARAAAERLSVTLVLPRPGQSVEPELEAAGVRPRWWPELAWETAEQHPILSTGMGTPVTANQPGGQP
ncbi:MBL fold metallo-hydrolase [Myxococcus sp. CA033]|uniref:MBL fold metallo-hydrolase n=1 Tax=Myxococcus sp. CA033 TaxID=2741516 RepID=UPI00157A6B7A|nr:MBL fold metallo-hydrolase [Myxococcus sp. CA033]NTX36677.1 MBL fold metallo-hydrolase [Myxococcus sp. CA033]